MHILNKKTAPKIETNNNCRYAVKAIHELSHISQQQQQQQIQVDTNTTRWRTNKYNINTLLLSN